MNQSRLLTAFLLLIGLLVAGCSGDGDNSVIDPNITQRVVTAGGTYTFQNGNVRLVVPASSVSSDTNVTVRAATGFPVDARLLAGTAYTITTDGATFSSTNKTRLRIRYGTLPVGADPNSLRVFRLSGTTWTEVDTTLDAANQVVIADLTAAGTYAVFVTGGTGAPDIFRTVLSPGQVVGATVNSNPIGTARVEVSSDRSTVQVRLQTSNFDASSVTSAHIHLGRLGATGEIQPAVTLYNESFGAFSNDYTRTFTEANLNTSVVANMEALINAIESGNAYVDIHTTAFANGELRGQLGTNVQLDATINGAQEVPPVTTDAQGTATVRFNQDMTSATVTVNTTGLTNVTAAHIHVAPIGQDGPVIFPLFASSSGTWSGTMTFTINESNFAAAGGVTTFNQAVAAILGGQTYINIHTQVNADGEIRGQIVPPLLD